MFKRQSLCALTWSHGFVAYYTHAHRDVHTFSGLSQAFFGLAAMPLAFERICSQSQPQVVGPLVAAALPLVGCGFDLARKTVGWSTSLILLAESSFVLSDCRDYFCVCPPHNMR